MRVRTAMPPIRLTEDQTSVCKLEANQAYEVDFDPTKY